MTPTAYIPIPASQPPLKQGYYHVIGGGEYYAFYHGGGLYPQNNGWDLPVTHWLKPADLSKMLADAFDAGQQWEYENMRNRKIVALDKSTYINSVLNPPK